jgi:hypothetical protein
MRLAIPVVRVPGAKVEKQVAGESMMTTTVITGTS